MKKKKLFVLVGIIFLLLCFVGLRVRFYYFNKYNLYAQRAIMNSLNNKYGQEFKLLSTEFETRENEGDGAPYIHIWTYTFEDEYGRIFNAYLWAYGVIGKGAGNSHSPDYGSYRSDNYCQLRIDECMGKEFELQNYLQEKSNENPGVDDYVFVCRDGNEEDIARVLMNMYFTESTFCQTGCLQCSVNDENGEPIFEYSKYTVDRALAKKDVDVANVSEEIISDYILQQLKH